MIYVLYKHVPFGENFIHNEIKYKKTSFHRGYYYKNGRIVFKNFKNKHLVQANEGLWDFPPEVKGK